MIPLEFNETFEISRIQDPGVWTGSQLLTIPGSETLRINNAMIIMLSHKYSRKEMTKLLYKPLVPVENNHIRNLTGMEPTAHLQYK